MVEVLGSPAGNNNGDDKSKASRPRGKFITLEGGEGTGKSTQAIRLKEYLIDAGHDVVLTREPGGSPGAEEIRSLLVSGTADRWSPLTETLLFFAARDEHLVRTIRPALDRGQWVICDRFADSTRAYQGAAGNISPGFLETLEGTVIGPDWPDLTLIFDLDPEIGLARAGQRMSPGHAEDRFEKKGLAFHERLRQAFLDIAANAPGRCAVIDASVDMDQVTRSLTTVVRERLVGAIG